MWDILVFWMQLLLDFNYSLMQVDLILREEFGKFWNEEDFNW